MPLPEQDVALVRNYVDGLNASMPEHVATQPRYEIDTYRNAMTLVECRLKDLDNPDGDWFRIPLARLRFFRSSGWEPFWADRDGNFHVYELLAPSYDVRPLIDEIRADPTAIFFG
jgi:Protein of unknown function (DUF3024)